MNMISYQTPLILSIFIHQLKCRKQISMNSFNAKDFVKFCFNQLEIITFNHTLIRAISPIIYSLNIGFFKVSQGHSTRRFNGRNQLFLDNLFPSNGLCTKDFTSIHSCSRQVVVFIFVDSLVFLRLILNLHVLYFL